MNVATDVETDTETAVRERHGKLLTGTLSSINIQILLSNMFTVSFSCSLPQIMEKIA